MRFRDRIQAGQALAQALSALVGAPNAIVLALPRGGVPVGFEVATALDLPLDVFVVRKLGVPGQEELAMGAIATGGVTVRNEEVVGLLGISPDELAHVAAVERVELLRRERLYRGSRPAPEIAGRTVLLVDDGVATGSTMRAAIASLRRLGAGRVVVAAPVAARSTMAMLRREADAVVVLVAPEPFYAVGAWFEDFRQTTDEEVRDLLERARGMPVGAPADLPA